ncbi:MAG: glycosyltransferase family 9 protein [Acetobacteraceae bacterium]|nr:glycosyltransferase family 9 protein [Acetobacteraceae bacterium]
MRILFITANRLGDAVLSTGLLDHLIRTYPAARITVACGPVAAGVFLRMPNLEQVIVIAKQPFGRHWLPLWRAAVTLWWDLIVDIRGSMLSWLVPARHRSIMRPGTGHKTVQLARVLRLDPAPLPVVWFSPEDSARVASLLPDGRAVIALSPTANWPPKVWPAGRFVALFERLAASHLPGAIPAVIAGPGEAEAAMARPVLQALPEAIDLVGRLNLPEIAAFLSRTRLFAGNDSGLMHLAAAAGTPTLGLFGPTNAGEYAPSGRKTEALSGLNREMESISVDMALGGAARLLVP